MSANALSIINADIGKLIIEILNLFLITFSHSFLGPSKDIIWVLLVFVLCQTVTFTVVGRMSDLFGRRWFFIGGNLLALVGYLICSRAHSINMLIGGVSTL
jgi:MFS family permease